MISDVFDFAMHTDRTRPELWHLLAMPQWFPRFFSGIGATVRVYEPGPDRSEAYSARAGGGALEVRDVRFRIRETRPESEFMIEGIDTAWFASVRFTDLPDGGTKISAAGFKTVLAHDLAGYDNAAIARWLRDGISRAVDYLAGAPTAVEVNTGSVTRTIANVGVISPTRIDRVVRQLNGLAKFGFTLAGGYAAASAVAGSNTAVIDDYGSHTFEHIHHRSQWLAAGMHQLGLGAGTTVGVLARNHASMVETAVACGKLGTDVVMINTGMSPRQIEELAARHTLAAMLLDDEFDELVYSLPDSILRICIQDDSAIPGRPAICELVGESASGYPKPDRPGTQIVLTSGTSGTPKAAKRPHPKGFGTVAAMLSKLPLQMNECMLIAAPLFHSWGFGLLQISTPIRATVVLQDRFDPEACLAAIAAHRCTALMVVPIMLQRLLDLPAAVRARYDTSSLRIIASCGSPLPGLLALQVMDVFGDVLYNFYGSTEVSWATVADPADLRVAPATAGKPPLGTTIAILDERGDTMPVGAVGRIFVGNEMLFDGYMNASRPQMADQLMDTGDLGYIDADGRLFVSGRDDDMIISGGENVFPRPVEDALAMLPQINEVAVIGVPDEEFGQRLAAYVVPHMGVALDVDMLRKYVRNRLNRFSVPRDFLFLEALPRNATGKILKRVLVRGDFDVA